MTSRTSYKKKKYSGPKASRKKRMAALKQFHGEGVCLADIYRLKNAGQLSFMKCVKCGSTNETDPTLNFYKFPYPNVNEKRRTAARAWAEYCWPDKVLTPEELTTVYKEKQMLCSKHFPDKETVRQYGLNTEIPIDLAALGCEGNKRKIVRTYRRKGAVGEKTVSNTSARQEQPKHNFLKASSDTELNFMEGENTAELFEPIDEVFEIEPEADGSLYEETVVKIEIEPADKNCDALLHEGYKCNICLSSISGYRYSCVQCESVDLCAACEARGAHDAHYVLRIPRPRPGAEEEIAEILKELREILNKHTNQPAEQIICTPSNCFPAAEDPLQATPVLQDVRSLAHSESESDNESSSASSEEGPPGRYTPHPHHPNRARSTHEKVPPKRRKLNPYKDTNRSTVTYASSSITNPIILKKPRKSINSDTFDENSDTDEVSEAVNERVRLDRSKANLDRGNEEADEELNIGHKLKKKPTSIEAASSPETVQQEEIHIKTEIDIPEDDVDLGIADDDNLGEGEDEQQNVELGDRQLEIGKKRGRKQVFNTKRLQRTDEEPLDFIVVDKNLENDPLASEETKKPRKKTDSLKMAIGEDVRMNVRRIKRFK